jgi:hypothetical protein
MSGYFFENAFVNHVMRRECILIFRLLRSAKLVEMCFGSGRPAMADLRIPIQMGATYCWPLIDPFGCPKILTIWP